MKQNLNIGQVVDDGSGDYLRLGGQKINNNFDELYYQLGDGTYPHAAGAWKTHSAATSIRLDPKMGDSFAINTQAARVTVYLPKGKPSDYNNVIRLRDVWSTWRLSPVTVVPASGDTIKGSASPKTFNTNYQDLELVYCSPGKWEYINGKTIEKFTNGDLATVSKKSVIATEGQTDFLDIFDGEEYNPESLNVYRRGNMLFYGENGFDPDNADYGSPGPNNTIVALNKKDVRLVKPCSVGDVIIFETFLDGIGVWRSSYNKVTVMVRSNKLTSEKTVQGSKIVADLSTLREFSTADLGVLPGIDMNPNSIEVEINGKSQVEAGTGGLPEFICEGAPGESSQDCIANGGTWVQSDSDYRLVFDTDGIKVSAIRFGQPFEDQDIITVRWYNNNIGTTMTLDDIVSETDLIYMNAEETVDLKNRIEYTDYQNPGQKTKVDVPNEYDVRLSNISAFFDSIYPIGTIYENAHNPANPRDYMGMGVWKMYGEGYASVGWASDISNPYFALNNNDLDSSGRPSHSAGGTVGEVEFQISANNIPELKSDDTVLIADDNGTVVIGGCQLDPDASGPGYSKYREGSITVNKGAGGLPISNVQPSITVYRWIRVA